MSSMSSMSSFFTMSLLEDGVEVRMPTELSSLISLLDREVPQFSCEGHGFAVTSGKGKVGARWELMVKSVKLGERQAAPFSVGRFELEKQDDGTVQFRIPPRAEQKVPDTQKTDPDSRLFGSFVYQMLNVFKRDELIDLPGFLPTV